MRPVGVEQSNSSVAFGEDSLMKVFRKVTPGVNPDIAIHPVLTEAGSKKRAGVWLETPEQSLAELAHIGPEALGLGA